MNGQSFVAARLWQTLYPQKRTQMQFFSDELYEAGRSHAEYERYWQTNAARMPRNLLRINGGMLPPTWFTTPDEAIWLHDARIRSVEKNMPNVTLHLRCDHHGAFREIILHYSDVSAYREVPDRLLADTPDSDLMCHETTALSNGRFSHKMLFATADVLSICEFSRLSFPNSVSQHGRSCNRRPTTQPSAWEMV